MKTLIVVGETAPSHAGREDEPEKDYIVLARALKADIAYIHQSYSLSHTVGRLEKASKLNLSTGIDVARRSDEYDVIVSTSEKVGIPVAWAMSITRKRAAHVMIGHKLSTGMKRPVLARMNVPLLFSDIICVSSPQRDFCVNSLRMPADRAHMIFDKVDHRFFMSSQSQQSEFAGAKGDYILAVGQEQRDYLTLARALSGMELQLIVVASSPWSSSQIELSEANNITRMSRISYADLRRLYSGARLVVLPLHGVDYAAGANGLLEAMAMGKAVISSNTLGLRDYLQWDDAVVCVPPDDPVSMRSALNKLLHDESKCRELGMYARRLVTQRMNIDTYVNAILQIIHSAHERKVIVR
jgi:glycosyltransferase involved in cell wall biosynthesis